MKRNINLDDYAAGAVQSAIYDMRLLDMGELRTLVWECVNNEADAACIYASDCEQIIRDYEADPFAADAADYVPEGTFRADEWQNAMIAYARSVAQCVIEGRAGVLADRIERAANTLLAAATAHGMNPDEDGDLPAPAIDRECPHGWAVHDREDDDGVCYWTQRNLEGCRAVALSAGGVWLSLTWEPVAAEATSSNGV